jgi:signal transduction histidine kinase/DNA-binding response OmpR family regulator
MKKFYVVIFLLVTGCISDLGIKKEKSMVIGFSQCTMVDEWRKAMVAEMQREIVFFRDYNIKFIVKDANDDNNKQISDIKELVKNGIDLLIVSPNEAEQLTPTVEDVYNKGIPVIVIDRKINSPNYTAFIGADNLAIGREAGYFANELLKGRGKILEITGLKGSTPAIERSKGFHEIIDKNPLIITTKIIEGAWLEEKTLKITDSLFYSFNDFNLIFAHNDFMANAASKSTRKHNIKPYLIGVDGMNTTNGGVNMIINGFIDGTILYPTGGDKAIQVAVEILSGKPYDKNINLNTYRIDNTNARTIWFQGLQMQDQQSKIDKQSDQLNNMSKVLNKRKTLLLLTYSTIILLIIMVTMIYISWRNKNRMNKVLDEKNKTISQQYQIITKQQADSLNLLIVAEEAKENKLRLFTDLSHEFRTVVTLITNPIQDIIRLTYDESIKNKLNILQRSADRLTRLTEGVLKFRNIDENKYHLTFFSANISQFVENVVETFQEQANKKDIKLISEINKEIYAEFDLGVIEKVMYNLISNAIKFTNSYGTVSIFLKAEDSKILIKVQDTGIGIPQSELPYLFDRFYRVNNLKNSSDNSAIGIGLALSKELIQLHSGQISVESNNKGTVFNVTIPQFHGFTKTETERRSIDINSINISNSDTLARGKTILLVEDNPDLLNVIASILGRYYKVTKARDGMQGLNLAIKELPDLILSDILMPVMDGMKMCIEIKKRAETCHIPVILLTAIDSQEYAVKGFEIGADAYITKPFNEYLLFSNIKNLIDSREKLKEHFSHSSLFKDLLQTKNKVDEDFLKNCLDSIYGNLQNENYTLTNLSEKMNMSRSSLYRRIIDVTNLRPVDFIKKAKLNYAAKVLLINNNYTINEISWRSGFSDPKYFSKCFLQEFGCYPSKYSEEFLKKEKSEIN